MCIRDRLGYGTSNVRAGAQHGSILCMAAAVGKSIEHPTADRDDTMVRITLLVAVLDAAVDVEDTHVLVVVVPDVTNILQNTVICASALTLYSTVVSDSYIYKYVFSAIQV